MNLYLLRVGADSTKLGGGFYSHICPDSKSYIFIPIPDEEKYLVKQEARTYRDYRWRNHLVCEYLPDRIQNRYIHNDPEFKTFTYGSPKCNQDGSGEKNYRTLAEIMKKGDMLTFYAAFTSNGRDIEGYYFFAYFIVDRAITFGNPDDLEEEDKDLVKNNHHFIHRKKLPNQVIVKGYRDPEKSRLFQRAVLLSSPKDGREGRNYCPCETIRKMLSYEKSMNMSSIRRFNNLTECQIARFRQYLDDNGGMIIDEG